MEDNYARVTPYYVEYGLDCGDNGKMESFIRYFNTPGQMFYWLSEKYAFDDCYEFYVSVIVMDGHQCKYAGWQPGMKFEYVDCTTGETVYEAYFEEWNH